MVLCSCDSRSKTSGSIEVELLNYSIIIIITTTTTTTTTTTVTTTICYFIIIATTTSTAFLFDIVVFRIDTWQTARAGVAACKRTNKIITTTTTVFNTAMFE